MSEANADLGLIGLAVMGQNLVLNMDDHGFTVAVFNRTVEKVDRFLANEAKGTKVIGHPQHPGTLRGPETSAARHAAGQGRQGRRRVHRQGHPPPRARRHHHRRREQQLQRHHPPDEVRREEGPALHRHGRLRRRGGRPTRAVHHARRLPRRLGTRQAHLPGRQRQEPESPDRRRRALLRVGRQERRRALRQDGPQRHRVRRHAADLRGLPDDEGRRHDQRRDAPGSSVSGTRASWTATSSRLPATSWPRRTPRRASTSSTRSSTPPARRAPASGPPSPPSTRASP